MLKNGLQGAFVAGVVGVWAVACSGAPDQQTVGAGDGRQQVANEDDEAASINQALHTNPKDPAALKRAREFNERNNNLLGLVHTVDMGDGRLVRFYQQASGYRTVSVKGRIGMPKLNLDAKGRNFSDIYRGLKPSGAVPQALVDADARHREQMLEQAEEPAVVPGVEATDVRAEESFSNDRAVTTAERVSPAKAAGTELVEKRMYCGEFTDQWCFDGGSSNFCQCYTEDNRDESRENVLFSYHAVAVPDGTVTVKISAGSVVSFREVLFQDDAIQNIAIGPDCYVGLWQACSGPKAVTHVQSIWGVDPGERVDRAMCTEKASTTCYFR